MAIQMYAFAFQVKKIYLITISFFDLTRVQFHDELKQLLNLYKPLY